MNFANLAGAWALLGLLAVLAIHLLRRRPRPLTISTLFLLEAAATASAGGRRVERLRHSLSLWLQLVAAALLAWLLMGPRLLREESAQKVAVVLDSTASMSAFRARALEALARRTERLRRRAARTEWILAESGLRRPPLYSGGDAAALLRAAGAAWDPRWPAHDVRPALESAREAVGPSGLVLLVTDHTIAVPAAVDRLAVGEPRDTVGFAGARVEEDGRWKAVVKNHGRVPATRRYTATVGDQVRPAGTLTLAPGEVHTISGPFPPGGAPLTLELEADAFTLDDRLPLVAPRPKTLHVQVAPEAASVPFVERFLATLDAVARDGPPDLCIVVASAGTRPSPPCPAIVFRAAPAATRFLPPAAAAGTHPLLEGLDWSGLLAPEAPALPAAPDDEVLVWAGPRPLVVLGRGTAGPQLLADFALPGSSAERVPAFPLLLHRFAERVRAGVVGREQANFETGSALDVALRAGAEEEVRLESGAGAAQTGPLLRAPLAPGFFTVRQGAEERVSGAAHFADTAEADLTQAASDDEAAAEPGRAEATERNSREHPLVPWATLLAGLLIALDWAGPRRSA